MLYPIDGRIRFNDAVRESVRLHRKRHGALVFERIAQKLIEEMAELTQALTKRMLAREEVRYELMQAGTEYQPAAESGERLMTNAYEILAEATDVLICLIHLQEYEKWDKEVESGLIDRAKKVARQCALGIKT